MTNNKLIQKTERRIWDMLALSIPPRWNMQVFTQLADYDHDFGIAIRCVVGVREYRYGAQAPIDSRGKCVLDTYAAMLDFIAYVIESVQTAAQQIRLTVCNRCGIKYSEKQYGAYCPLGCPHDEEAGK